MISKVRNENKIFRHFKTQSENLCSDDENRLGYLQGVSENRLGYLLCNKTKRFLSVVTCDQAGFFLDIGREGIIAGYFCRESGFA